MSVLKEIKKDGFEEVPIFGPNRKKGPQPQIGAFEFVNVKRGEVTLAGRCDIETKAMFGARLKKMREFISEELFDFGFASLGPVWAEFAELLADLIRFEVDALDFVIEAAALDGGPFHNGGGGSTEGITHVGLLKDFFGASATAALGDEFFGLERSVLGAVDDIDEAVFDGVGKRDAEVQIPGGGWSVGVLECWSLRKMD